MAGKRKGKHIMALLEKRYGKGAGPILSKGKKPKGKPADPEPGADA